jgi:NodT family efflux transporter outer membrane factor (OMF) lipoprotein
MGRAIENRTVPASYSNLNDSLNSGKIKWRDFFEDPFLVTLIDSALKRNQDLNVMIQEIKIAQNEVRARKGAYLPFMNVGVWAGVDHMSRYTRLGAVDATDQIEPEKPIPNPLPDYAATANLSWQVDIWKQLRNAKKSALLGYLSSTEGKNFMVTNLVADIASAYYELMALDNQLQILEQNIEIQTNALNIVSLQKKAGKVTELAVRRFQAEVNKNQSTVYMIRQQIIETENRINFLVGRFPQPVVRNSQSFSTLLPDSIHAGLPSQLLENRPDIRQAELDLLAAKLDVKVAKANFYPQLNISAIVGLEAFKPAYLLSRPESMMYTVGGGLIAPLINRNAIKATYYSANARQIQAVFNYERTVLNAYIEVANQLANIGNLRRSYERRNMQVTALTKSIDISISLFKTAMADYMEVLLTQRDALSSKFELVETKKQRMFAMVNIYQALGGGWN